jgi:hypothetical protein
MDRATLASPEPLALGGIIDIVATTSVAVTAAIGSRRRYPVFTASPFLPEADAGHARDLSVCHPDVFLDFRCR